MLVVLGYESDFVCRGAKSRRRRAKTAAASIAMLHRIRACPRRCNRAIFHQSTRCHEGARSRSPVTRDRKLRGGIVFFGAVNYGPTRTPNSNNTKAVQRSASSINIKNTIRNEKGSMQQSSMHQTPPCYHIFSRRY